jgi:hypothetical protein
LTFIGSASNAPADPLKQLDITVFKIAANGRDVKPQNLCFQLLEPSKLPNPEDPTILPDAEATGASAQDHSVCIGGEHSGGGAFSKWGKAGFKSDLIPLIPPDARLSATSSVKIATVGKVPGKLLSEGAWCGFTEFTTHYATAEDIIMWDTWTGAGIGLIGRGNPAVDIDITDPLLAGKVRALAIDKLGPAPCRIGNAPKCLLMYSGRLEKKLRLVLEKNGDLQAIECLGARGHYVVEGIHPKTRVAYKWDVDPTDFSFCPVSQTDLVSFLDAVAELAAAEGWTVKTSSSGGAYVCQPAPDGFEANTDRIINRLTTVLQTIAPAIEGNGGDEYTVKHVAMLCGDHGVTEDMALELLLEHWNPRCEPPWDQDELRGKVHRAYQKRQNDIGSHAIEEGWPPLWLALSARDPSLMPPNEVIGHEQCSVHRDAIACLEKGDCNETPILAGTEKGQAMLQKMIEDLGGVAPEQKEAISSGVIPNFAKMSFKNWRQRNVLPRASLIGGLLSTTSRLMLIAPTGLGKTHLGMTVAAHVALGRNFLHWRVERPARMLYLDGEMPEGLMQDRINDLARRLDLSPEDDDLMDQNLIIVSRENNPDMPPLNTIEGQRFTEAIITKLGPFDGAIFDNIQALAVGNMRETEM